METISETALLGLPRWNRPLVTLVPRPARARLPELPGALGVGAALVAAASMALVAGSVGLVSLL